MDTLTFNQEKLFALRTKRGWSRQDLAVEVAMRGSRVHPETIRQWEKGKANPDADMLPVLAAIFRITIQSLYTNGE